MRVTIILILSLATLLNVQLIAATPSNGFGHPSQRKIAEARTLPHMGVEYSRVTKLKLTSRKKAYRVGEMISLDVAIMNISDDPIFLDGLTYAEFDAHDTRKQKSLLFPYYFIERNVLPDMFTILKPDSFELLTLNVLAGCDNRATEMRDAVLDEKNKQKEIFERGLFASWGWGCLQVDAPGTYTITVKLITNHVVVAADQPQIKTAIGSMTSEPLDLLITK
jgi:hypothetical protein